jgi:transposase InsO family protein
VALSLDEARVQIIGYIAYYNDERLHSAIGYIAPKDKLEGLEEQIFEDRDRKLEAARAARKLKRSQRAMKANTLPSVADRNRVDKVKPPAGALRDLVNPDPVC